MVVISESQEKKIISNLPCNKMMAAARLLYFFWFSGLYCESYANVHGAAVETQHFGSTDYGLCEHKVNMSTPGY